MNLSRMYWMPLRLQGIRLSVKAESQWIAFQDVMYCSESEGRTGKSFYFCNRDMLSSYYRNVWSDHRFIIIR